MPGWVDVPRRGSGKGIKGERVKGKEKKRMSGHDVIQLDIAGKIWIDPVKLSLPIVSGGELLQ